MRSRDPVESDVSVYAAPEWPIRLRVRTPDELRRHRPRSRDSRRPRRRRAFSRALRQRPAQTAASGRSPLVYSPARAFCSYPHDRRPPKLLRRSRLELPAQLEPPLAWEQIRAELRGRSATPRSRSGSRRSSCRSWRRNVAAPRAREHSRRWVAKRFGRVLASVRSPGRSARRAFESTFSGGDRACRRPGPADEFRTEPADGAQPALQLRPVHHRRRQPPRPRRRAGGRREPRQAYNPLFLYAPPGPRQDPPAARDRQLHPAFGDGATVRYTTVETFTNHFIAALQQPIGLERFKRAYRDADVLLIDDVQFLARKAKTEEEFFHTFNALYETGRQLVLTCDRLPRQLSASRSASASASKRASSPTSSRRTSPRASRSSASEPRSTTIAARRRRACSS